MNFQRIFPKKIFLDFVCLTINEILECYLMVRQRQFDNDGIRFLIINGLQMMISCNMMVKYNSATIIQKEFIRHYSGFITVFSLNSLLAFVSTVFLDYPDSSQFSIYDIFITTPTIFALVFFLIYAWKYNKKRKG